MFSWAASAHAIARIDAAAVQDRQRCTRHFLGDGLDASMLFFCKFGRRRGSAFADRPNRLISNDDIAAAWPATSRNSMRVCRSRT